MSSVRLTKNWVHVVRWVGVLVPRHTIDIYRPFLHFRLEFYFFRSQSTVVVSPDATYEKPQIAIGFCFAEAQVCSYATFDNSLVGNRANIFKGTAAFGFPFTRVCHCHPPHTSLRLSAAASSLPAQAEDAMKFMENSI